MSQLPDYLEEDTIRGMLPGDKGFTVPWAMYADVNRTLWINGKYPVKKKASGTMCMKIVRLNGGVAVEAKTLGTHRYSPGPPGFVGGSDDMFVELRGVFNDFTD